MGLNLGKFLTRAFDPKKIVPIATSLIGGNYLGALSSAAGNVSFGSGQPAQYAQPSATFPAAGGGGMPLPVPVAQRGAVVTRQPIDQELFNAALKILDRVGIRVMNPNAVIGQLRRVLAGMLRFARRTPGLTIVSLLANLGLSAVEANRVVVWYSTSGKKTRRVRVTNVKALNRSVRRLEGFMRLARRVEGSLAMRARKSVGRAKRCYKCRKSPCCC